MLHIEKVDCVRPTSSSQWRNKGLDQLHTTKVGMEGKDRDETEWKYALPFSILYVWIKGVQSLLLFLVLYILKEDEYCGGTNPKYGMKSKQPCRFPTLLLLYFSWYGGSIYVHSILDTFTSWYCVTRKSETCKSIMH